MANSKKHIITRDIPHRFFVDGNFEADFYDLISLLEELHDCDGLFNAMNISNKKTAEYLEKKKIIFRTVRYSYALKNDNLRKKLLAELYKLDENYDKENKQ